MAKGKSGSFRCVSLTSSGLLAMEAHELRLDYAGQRNCVVMDANGDPIPPLIYNPGGLNCLTQAHAAHVAGARMNKGAGKVCRHAFIQFPTEMKITPQTEQMMLDQAVAFVDRHHGGKAVFWARLDRDEAGRHGVDVFFAPRYEKTTKTGSATWVSLTKFGKALAFERFGMREKQEKNRSTGKFQRMTDKSGDPVLFKADSAYFQGRAYQDLWFEHLRDQCGLEWVARGTKKVGRDPDSLSVEEYKAAQEREKATARAVALAEKEAAVQRKAEATKNAEDELRLAASQLADLQERYRTLASSPLEVPRIPDPPLIGGRDAWRAEVQKVLADYATSIDIQKKDMARQRREVDERIKVAERAERERGLRLQTRQDREAAQKALDAKMAKGEAAIAELSKITTERNRGAPTLAEVMNHLGFLKLERFDPKASGFWLKDRTTVIGLAGGDGWQLHRHEKQPRQGAGIANLLTLILGSAEKAIAFLMRHFREGRVSAYLDEITRKASSPDRLPSSPAPSSAAPSGGWERGPGM